MLYFAHTSIGLWAQPEFFPAKPPTPRDFGSVQATEETDKPNLDVNRYRYQSGSTGAYREVEEIGESLDCPDWLFDHLESLRWSDRAAWSEELETLSADTYRAYMIDRISRWHQEEARPELKRERRDLEDAVECMRNATRAEAYDRKGQSIQFAISIRERCGKARSMKELYALVDEVNAFDARTQQLVSVKALREAPQPVWDFVDRAFERAEYEIRVRETRRSAADRHPSRKCSPEMEKWLKQHASDMVNNRPLRVSPRSSQIDYAISQGVAL